MTGQTQAMLEEAAEFVEPDGRPSLFYVVGHDGYAADHLRQRMADLLRQRGDTVRSIRWDRVLQSGNCRIRFVSAHNLSQRPWIESGLMFWDHHAIELEGEKA